MEALGVRENDGLSAQCYRAVTGRDILSRHAGTTSSRPQAQRYQLLNTC